MTDYIIIFSAGLFGAVHCAGMCGGLVMACAMKCGGGFRFSFLYNIGRVLSYAMLGLAIGLLGKALIAAGAFGRFQSVMPVVAGVFMITIGVEMLGLIPSGIKSRLSLLFPTPAAGGFIARQIKKRSAAFFLGMLNGLIPCGFLYGAGIKAASTADPFEGVLVMLSLGAGTFVPMLFAGSLSSLRIRSNLFAAFSSVLIIALGLKAVFFTHAHASNKLLAALYPLCSF
ncbi:MAG: sulfite exporter TauE/SafE family protein [Deltaproteobacteria bacterium]|nr:sulfite exporter TauE/SafE family protein [Deltaproteobacteria bacterium]